MMTYATFHEWFFKDEPDGDLIYLICVAMKNASFLEMRPPPTITDEWCAHSALLEGGCIQTKSLSPTRACQSFRHPTGGVDRISASATSSSHRLGISSKTKDDPLCIGGYNGS